MKQQTTTDQLPSSVCFDSLENHIRQQAQKWLQRILEEAAKRGCRWSHICEWIKN